MGRGALRGGTTSPPGSTCRSSSGQPRPHPRSPMTTSNPFGMRNQCPKPARHGGAGHLLHSWHRDGACRRHRRGGRGRPVLPDGGKRGIAPLGGAHFRIHHSSRVGNAMYHLMLCDEFGARGGVSHRAGAGGRTGREAGRARHGDRPDHRRQRPARDPGDQGGRPQVTPRPVSARPSDAVPASDERVMGTADAAEGIRSFVERPPGGPQGR